MFAGIAILTLGLLKLVINMVKMLSVKRHLESYAKWLKEGTGAAVFENRGVAIRLLEEAGVTDASLPYAEPIGFGQVATSSMSVFENYPANRKDLVIIMVQKFQEAIGTYRSRSLEAINPLYWIELLLFLPKHVIGALGGSPEQATAKALTFVYWLLASIAGFAWTFAKSQLLDWLNRL